MRYRLSISVILALLVLGLAPPARGMVPVPGGAGDASIGRRSPSAPQVASTSARILFVRGTWLWSCKPDGSDQTRLARAGQGAIAAAWSPDRRSIAFIRYASSPSKGTLWRMNADGSGQRKLVYSGPSLTLDCGGLAWSPDGNHIAGGNFSLGSSGPGVGHVAVLDLRSMTSRDLFTLLPSVNGVDCLSWSPDEAQLLVVQEGGDTSWLMRIDASSGRLLQNYAGVQPGINAASFSPRGDRIAYSYSDLGHSRFGMRIAHVDGRPVRSLSHGHQYEPLWSPDGTQIVFSGDHGLWVVAADGTGKHQIVKGGHAEAWR